MSAFIALLLKILPLILALFGIVPAVASYHALGGVEGGVGANAATFQYVGGYSALAVAGWGIGEWIRSIASRMMTGGVDITRLIKMVQLLMKLIALAKSDPETLKLLEEVLGFKLTGVPQDEKTLVRLLLEQ